MNALRELIEAAEQAGRNEVIRNLRETGLYTEQYLTSFSDESGAGALSKVIKVAAANAREDAFADAIRRFSSAVIATQGIRDENADLRQQLTELRDENASLRQDLTELENQNAGLRPYYELTLLGKRLNTLALGLL